MKQEGSKSHLRCSLPTVKFVCPKMKWKYDKLTKRSKRVCHCENPCTESSCGRMFYLYPEKNLRAYLIFYSNILHHFTTLQMISRSANQPFYGTEIKQTGISAGKTYAVYGIMQSAALSCGYIGVYGFCQQLIQ